ncbi:MAG: hypothetical protein H6618_01175 [Deltaproteobacteria bacterium]|nr:hypothetical protein [Deltaproteobacteria bacterium]
MYKGMTTGHQTTELHSPTVTEGKRLSWNMFFKHYKEILNEFRQYIYPSWLYGFHKLNFKEDETPELCSLNYRLAETGWQLVRVGGYLPSVVYSEYLSAGLFPVASYIRPATCSTHSPQPDFIHDVLGHLPMLFDPSYGHFLKQLATEIAKCGPDLVEQRFNQINNLLGMQAAEGAGPDYPELQSELTELQKLRSHAQTRSVQLSNLMLWTIEFGLMSYEDCPKVYGAGILSSQKELRKVISSQDRLRAFTTDTLKLNYNFTSVQNQYFYASSFEELSAVLHIC